MKKIVLMAFAAAMMAGCSNDKQLGNKDLNPENAIDFRTVTSKNHTRATEVDDTNIRDFKVFGLWGTNYDFMHNVTVTRDVNASTWSYSPLRYWPSTGNVDFYAYSPAGSRGVTSIPDKTEDITEIDYTVPATAKLQEDFLVANALGKSKSDGQVALTFDHALSQLVFEARSGLEDVIFHISDITITEMDSEGTFDLKNYSVASNTGWTTTDSPTSYSAALTTLPVIFDYDAGNFIRLTGPNDGLMVLPQALETGNTLNVTYSAQLNSGAVIASGTVTLNLYDNSSVPSKFEMGKRYIFKLTMTTGLTPITFTVEVNDWKTVADPVLPVEP